MIGVSDMAASFIFVIGWSFNLTRDTLVPWGL